MNKETAHHSLNRRAARELLMQVLFQMEAQQDFSKALRNRYLDEITGVRGQLAYIDGVFSAVVEHLAEIDGCIEAHSPDWKLSRMPKVDLAILRLAAAEILYMEEIPREVSINEAVNLAKKFSTEKSGRFINGLLSKIEPDAGE